SAEHTGSETTWSLGEYTAGADIWKMFGLPGEPPKPTGIFANQPSPHAGKRGSAWRLYLLFLLAIIVLAIFFGMTAQEREVFRQSYDFSPRAGGEASFVTPTFELKGHTSNVEIET